jgi:hypothetical protein
MEGEIITKFSIKKYHNFVAKQFRKKNMDLFIFWPNFALEAFSFFSPIGTIVFPFNLCLFA